jgi:RNA polymerase sigma-70 factor (ECF subfamily)
VVGVIAKLGVRVSRSDAELIVASRRDEGAFRELYDRWAERLFAYFYRRVFDREVAADLLAETFAVAFAKRERFRDVGRPGGAWLYGIAERELARYFRRRKVELRALARLGVERPSLDPENVAAIDAMVAADRRRGELLEAMAKMSLAAREAVSLRVIDELDYATIGQRLGCSEVAARVRVHRGLAKLNELLEVER